MPILIVQHMPKLFTQALAARLAMNCALEVRLAKHGELVQPGTVLLAPGDLHMEVQASAHGTCIRLHQGPPENHTRPAVDPLFRSLARVYGQAALGVVLTGMGSDGCEGASEIARAGGAVLAQDEASSAVWGMPGRVVQAGIAETVPLHALAQTLHERCGDEFTANAGMEAHHAMQ